MSRSGISFVEYDRNNTPRNVKKVQTQREKKISERRETNIRNDSDEQRMHVAHAIHTTI